MKLNQEQITTIKAFISKRGFTAIDLQLEILDHVACRIEDKMLENPKLSFEQALRQTHTEFGALGFSTFEEAMVASLNHKYRNEMWLELKKWCSFPAVFAVGVAAFLLYSSFLVIPASAIIITASVCYMVLAIWAVIHHMRLRMRYRKLMAMQATNSFAFFPGFILQIGLYYGGSTITHWTWACAYTTLILLFAFFFAATFRVMDFAVIRCQELEKQYSLLLESQKNS